jgi:ribonuclease HII
VAKVTRDRAMLELHGRDPRYGFDRHKGYATATISTRCRGSAIPTRTADRSARPPV